jgi:HAD superfamily hydrolase (TIGR01549 family)
VEKTRNSVVFEHPFKKSFILERGTSRTASIFLVISLRDIFDFFEFYPLNILRMSRFLRNGASVSSRRFRHIVFDLDGTLTKPNAIDFASMRSRCNAPKGVDILSHIESHKDESKRRELHMIVEEEERKGLDRLELQEHCDELFEYLEKKQIKCGILTRNNDEIMMKSVQKMKRGASSFEIMLSRSFQPTKPSGEPLHFIARHFSVSSQDLIMIGDSIDDIQSAKNAGSFAVLIGHESSPHFKEAFPLAHASVSTLKELEELIEHLCEVSPFS